MWNNGVVVKRYQDIGDKGGHFTCRLLLHDGEEIKMKKAVLILAIATLLAGFAVTDAKADWVTCNVVSVGQLGELTGIMLTDSSNSFANRWFLPLSTKSKEMLATAMFAAANSRKVTVYVQSSAEYSTIVVMALTVQ